MKKSIILNVFTYPLKKRSFWRAGFYLANQNV